MQVNGVKVFSATKAKDREELGDRLTQWLRGPGAGVEVEKIETMQSSDNEFHCLSLVVFYREEAPGGFRNPLPATSPPRRTRGPTS